MDRVTDRVTIDFHGSFDTGFDVTITSGKDDSSCKLTPNRELRDQQVQWNHQLRTYYQALEKCPRGLENVENPAPINEEELNQIVQNLHQITELFIQNFTRWINPIFEFVPRRIELDTKRLIIRLTRADMADIRKSPWEKIFKNYIVSYNIINQQLMPSLERSDFTVFGIIDKSQNIETGIDKEIIETMVSKALLKIKPVFPQIFSAEEMNDLLLDKTGYDFFIYSGHSQDGLIQLSSQNAQVSQFESAFRQAVKSGLHTAIFNSCHGLDIATRFTELELPIPNLIVMRHSVPDGVAHKFLKCFLQKYWLEHEPIDLAVKQASKHLEGIENDFPYASYLPVICQNHAANQLNFLDAEKPPYNYFRKNDNYFRKETEPQEQKYYQKITNSSSLVRIQAINLTPIQEVLKQINQEGKYKVVNLDCSNWHSSSEPSLNQFLKYICQLTQEKINFSSHINWNNQEYSNIFRALLRKSKWPLILTLNNFDNLCKYPWIDNFCTLLRSWIQKGNGQSAEASIWKKLKIIIIYADTGNCLKVRNTNRIFDMGQFINLTN